MEDMETEAEVFVIYTAGKGFVQGRQRMRFTPHFTKARVYNRKCDAMNSKKMWADREGDSHVIPVQLVLDPKKLFKTLLKGSS